MATLLTRYLRPPVANDLETKMVFVGGPRQVGKTTFAQSLLPSFRPGHPGYLNYDDPEHRARILDRDWPAKQRLIVLDELHKYARWRNFIKGTFDTMKGSHEFLLTGSARLDYYRKGGDSLVGRYHYYRLHPLSLPELDFRKDAVESLLMFGGFPEPFLAQSERTVRRWHLQRVARVIAEDLRDLERIRELSLVERLAESLPARIGSPLSIKGVAQDLQVDFKTAERWIIALENLYYCYRVPPFNPGARIRAVRKEQKLYLWDWSQAPTGGLRFENLVASHLLKFCHYRSDVDGHKVELRFLRDTDKREVDFVVIQNRTPLFAVECKTGEKHASSALHYFSERSKIPMFYQVHLGKTHRTISDRISIIPFSEFCREVGLV